MPLVRFTRTVRPYRVGDTANIEDARTAAFYVAQGLAESVAQEARQEPQETPQATNPEQRMAMRSPARKVAK